MSARVPCSSASQNSKPASPHRLSIHVVVRPSLLFASRLMRARVHHRSTMGSL